MSVKMGLSGAFLGRLQSIKLNKLNLTAFAVLRKYATHREVGQGFSPSYSGSRRPWGFWWKPLAFTAGVLLFDHYILPPIVNSAPFSSLVRDPRLAVYGLVALNAAGFMAWRIPGAPSQFMRTYGLLQKFPSAFRGFQLLGSAFSHQNFWHFAINNFVLLQFAGPLATLMGTTGFLSFYLDSCVLSSLGSMLIPLLLRRPQMLPSLGASGAVFSCLGVFCYIYPDARLALWFIPLPVGAWTVFVLTTAFNVFAAVRSPATLAAGGIDYAGHIAGSLCGVVYGKIVQDSIDRRRRRFRSAFRYD